QIHATDVFQHIVLKVYELLRAEAERLLTVGSASCADNVRAGLTCELGCHRADYAGRAVYEGALPRAQATVFEESLPRGQPRHDEGRGRGKLDVARQRREIACLDSYVFGQRAVAIPVGEAEHSLSHRQPRRSIAKSGDRSGQLVPGDG